MVIAHTTSARLRGRLRVYPHTCGGAIPFAPAPAIERLRFKEAEHNRCLLEMRQP